MADVKWIKIVTDIFDDEKILLIESMPDADSIIVIWFKLLCLAGKQNNSGVFVMSNGIPYTEQMIATIFRRKETVVALALRTFQQFGMIEIIEDTITIPKWGNHQNLDKIEAKTEYQRQYMREYRAKQKQLAAGTDNKSNRKTNSNANVSPLDKKENKSISSSPDGEVLSISELFSKTYDIYPRKQGKAKGLQAYRLYLTKGKDISGVKYRYNHQQLYFAIQQYATDSEGKDSQFIKHFDTFMNSTVTDFVEQSKADYTAFMAEKYGEGWQEVKFSYA